MITSDDIKKLKGVFVTKDDLKQFATKVDLAKLQMEMNERFEAVEERMATKDDFRKVMTVLDKVLKEVLAIRQEQSVHTGDHMRINERLNNIEKVPVIAHALKSK